MILEFWGKEIWVIEIKHSSSPKLSKRFYSACNDINPDQKFVIYSGSDRFSMGNDITAISLVDLMNRIIEI